MTASSSSDAIVAFVALCTFIAAVAGLAVWLRRTSTVSGIVRRAWRDWHAERRETAMARLERLLPRLAVDRDHPDAVDAVAALAEMRASSGDADEALALAGRLPLRSPQLEEAELDWLASRAVVHARTGMLPKARADRARLYSFDPHHPRLEEVDEEIVGARSLPRPIGAFASLTPDQFEDLVGRMFAREGFEVRVTESSGDGGVDLVCLGASGREIVQCKRYTSHSVGVDAVRSLYGVMGDFGAHHAHVVTSAGFTEGAQQFAIGKPISLVDGEELLSRLRGVGLA
jgi:hypothetical protein